MTDDRAEQGSGPGAGGASGPQPAGGSSSGPQPAGGSSSGPQPAGGSSGTQGVGGSPGSQGSGPRAETLALQGLANVIVRGLLRAPVLSRLVGSRMLTLYVVGRKSGKRYSVPVTYTRHDGVLVIGSPFPWGKNLRTGEPVEVRYRGKRRVADVQVLTDEAGVVEHYAVISRDNHNFAGFNKIRIDENGEPDPKDLHESWVAGARAFRLTLR